MKPASRLVQSLYRAVLRSSRQFDKHRQAKALIYFNFDGVQNDHATLSDIISTPPVSAESSAQELFNSYVRTSLHHKHLFPLEELGTTHIESVVKRAFREQNAASLDRRIDAAFIAMRKLGAIWNTFAEKRSAAAALQPVVVPINAELTDRVTRGSVLIAHPLLHGPLARSVIVVLDHGSHGTYGLMINRPTPFLVATSIKNLPEDVTQMFGQHRVRCGGVIRRLQFLHPFQDCGGTALEVENSQEAPLYAGGQVEQAVERVKRDPASADKFMFFAGCCQWDGGYVDDLVDEGYFIPARAPLTDLLMNTNPEDVDIWSSLMQALGEPYSATSLLHPELRADIVDACRVEDSDK